MQDAPQQENPKKLFVGNLPFSTTEEEVVSMFSDFGTVVDAALIKDRMSGRSKGIAFVTFETEEEANAAIEGLNGKDIDGRALVVNVARPRVPRTDGFGGGNSNGGRRSFDRNNDRRGGGGGQRRY